MSKEVCSAEDCEEAAVNFCTEDCDFLCHQCADVHNKYGSTKNHKVISASEGREFIKCNEPLEGGGCLEVHQHQPLQQQQPYQQHEQLEGGVCLEVHQHQPLQQQQPYQQHEQHTLQQQILMLYQHPKIRNILRLIGITLAATFLFFGIFIALLLLTESLSDESDTEDSTRTYTDQGLRTESYTTDGYPGKK